MTLALITILKVLAFIGSLPILAIMILFPINDQPTSLTQKIVFVVVIAVLIDVLFLHYIHLNIDMSLGNS